MNLYCITQDEATNYEAYDAAVVCAESEDDAKTIHPGGGWGDDAWSRLLPNWCDGPDQVEAELIGAAAPGVERGVVLASYREG